MKREAIGSAKSNDTTSASLAASDKFEMGALDVEYSGTIMVHSRFIP